MVDLSWLPKKFNPDKHRRLYFNIPPDIDRDKLREITLNIIKAFRVAIAEYYRAKGYRLSKEVQNSPEVYGPTPEILWIKFSGKSMDIVVGDTSIPSSDDINKDVFINTAKKWLEAYGFKNVQTFLIGLEIYRYPSLKNSLYISCELR